MADPLKLGISPCPNDTFIFHAWAHGLVAGAPEIEITFADIDVLNHLALEGALDVVKISYGVLDQLDGYSLLESGSALGRGCGPLVLTRPDQTSLEGATVAIPGPQTTANLLMQLWPGSAAIARVVVLPFEQIMPAVAAGQVDAGLVIHESRFTYPSHRLVAVQDLGEWWESETSLPIPLGGIVARSGLDTAQLSSVIRRSVEIAWEDPSLSRGWVLEHSQEMEPAVVDAHIGLYVNEFSADLGPEGHAAIDRLLSVSRQQH